MMGLVPASQLFLKKNASSILTGLGVTGVVATAVLAVKATPKAERLIEEAKKEKEELTNVEIIKAAAPAYIPTAIVGVSTITCILGANVLNKRQQAAITSAYALLDNAYKEYRGKVAELYGDEKEEEVRNKIIKDKYEPVKVPEGEQLFYDEFSKQLFTSTLFKVQQAEYYLNRDLTMRDYAYVNEFYEYLDIDPIEAGWKMGWSVGGCLAAYWQPWIDFNHRKIVMDDGSECIAITMFQEPFFDFENYA